MDVTETPPRLPDDAEVLEPPPETPTDVPKEQLS
jgi:hypothetical protein